MSIFLFGVDKAMALVKDGNHDALSRLLSRNPKLVLDRDRNGNTCLLIAALYNRLDVALLLLLRGADINAASGKGYTPLHISVEKGFVSFATMLCERGADCSAINASRHTPLHLAVMNRTVAMINDLCARGTMDAIDKDKRTPLHVAMLMGHVDLACMLVERGCDINIRNKEKLTPAEAARKLGYLAVCDIIEFRLDRERQRDKEREKEAAEREARDARDAKKKEAERQALRENPPHTPAATREKVVSSSSRVHGSGASVTSQRSAGSSAGGSTPGLPLRASPSGHADAYFHSNAAGDPGSPLADNVEEAKKKKKKKKVRTAEDDGSVMTGVTGQASHATQSSAQEGTKTKKKKTPTSSAGQDEGGHQGGGQGGLGLGLGQGGDAYGNFASYADDDASTVVTTKSGALVVAKRKQKSRGALDDSTVGGDSGLGSAGGDGDMVSALSMSTLSLGSKKKKKKKAVAAEGKGFYTDVTLEDGEGGGRGLLGGGASAGLGRHMPLRRALMADPRTPQGRARMGGGDDDADDDDDDDDADGDLVVEHIPEDPLQRSAKLRSLVYNGGGRGEASQLGTMDAEFAYAHGPDTSLRRAAGGKPVLCGLYQTPPRAPGPAPGPAGSPGSHGSSGSLVGATGSPGSRMRVAMDGSAAATTAALLRKERGMQQVGPRTMCSSPEGRCVVM